VKRASRLNWSKQSRDSGLDVASGEHSVTLQADSDVLKPPLCKCCVIGGGVLAAFKALAKPQSRHR
jgi:hypothetical protein